MLLELLGSLSPEDWEKQTVSPKWKVKDVAAHLLDTALRGISIARDGYSLPAPNIDSRAALGAYIDRLNEEGVKVYRRLSPKVLIPLMETACKQLAEYHGGRDPFAPAPVSDLAGKLGEVPEQARSAIGHVGKDRVELD